MNKKIIISIILSICILFLSVGCIENKNNNNKNFEGITLESDVVELVNASMNFKYDKTNSIKSVEVIYLFKNIANHIIETLNITINFFDKNNNLIASGGPKYIRNLPIGYIETYAFEANKIAYEGPELNLIDHCVIYAIEN